MIFDAAGRLVKSFNHLTLQPFNQITWHGTDDNNRALPSGVYLVMLEANGEKITEKVVLLSKDDNR
jgi:flagellar hook assembly protein FlgD